MEMEKAAPLMSMTLTRGAYFGMPYGFGSPQ